MGLVIGGGAFFAIINLGAFLTAATASTYGNIAASMSTTALAAIGVVGGSAVTTASNLLIFAGASGIEVFSYFAGPSDSYVDQANSQ